MAKPTAPHGGPLILLDGMSLAFRAYFALPPDLTTSTGVVTNALHGFASMLHNLVRDHRPSALAVAFDLPGPTFRDELLADYKGGRAETPADLTAQFAMIRSLLDSLAIPVVGVVGYEADDVLATLATEARDRACPVIVVTGDRDSYQLVEDPYIRVLYNRRGVSDYVLYDEQGIEDRTGVRPERYPLLASLRGDPSDNLPGVPGVGEKTAAKLVNEYGDLDTIYAHLDALSPKLRQNLADHLDRVRLNSQLIPLVRTVPLETHVDDLRLGGWDGETARATFAEFELRTIWTRFQTLMKDGLLGEPIGGAGPLDDGDSGLSTAGDTPIEMTPEWLEKLTLVVPLSASEAVDEVERVLNVARSRQGHLAIFARWDGLAGRSPLRSLSLVPEPAGAETDATESSDVRDPLDPVLHLEGGEAGPLSDPGLLAALGGGLGQHGVGVVGHDIKELMRWLLPLGVDITGLVMDTAVAAYLLDASSDRYPLADLAAAYLRVTIDDGSAGKGQGSFALDDEDIGGVDTQALSAARQAAVIARLRRPLAEALADAGATRLHDEIDRPLVRVLARMEVTGVPADREVLSTIAAGLVEECRSLEGTIQELAGGPFNVNSVPQLRQVLYERLELKPIRKTKTGYSTDARTLEQLKDQHPVVVALLRYREVEKLRSTYGESLAAEVADDGRIHATFRQTVARTGRLSSDRPNLHNIPVRTEEGRRFRQAFVPSVGRRLLVADYDQVELRAIAHLSGDVGLTTAFANGEDIHRTVASQVFGVERDEVSSTQRSTAKMVSYGLAYGMEAYGLAQRLGVPVDEANVILRAFFDAFPAVREYMAEAVATARNTGYTVTEFGRRRLLPDLVSSNYQTRQGAERQAMNAGIQGLAADLFKVALIRLDGGLERGGFTSDLVLQVHDEVMIDVAPDEEAAVAELAEQELTGAANLTVPLKVAMAWGASWAEAKG